MLFSVLLMLWFFFTAKEFKYGVVSLVFSGLILGLVWHAAAYIRAMCYDTATTPAFKESLLQLDQSGGDAVDSIPYVQMDTLEQDCAINAAQDA